MVSYKAIRIKKSSVIFWLLTLLSGIFIFSLSSQTGEESAGLSISIAKFAANLFYGEPSEAQIENVHYFIRQLARFVLFMGFGFLAAEAAYVTFTRYRIYKVFLVVSLLCSGLAFFDEWRKQFIPGRHFQLDEAFFNILSIWIGSLIAILVLHLSRKLYIKITNK